MADVCDDDGVSGESLMERRAERPFSLLYAYTANICSPQIHFDYSLLTRPDFLNLFNPGFNDLMNRQAELSFCCLF